MNDGYMHFDFRGKYFSRFTIGIILFIFIVIFFPVPSHIEIEGGACAFVNGKAVDEKFHLYYDAWVGSSFLGKDIMSAHISLLSDNRGEILSNKKIEGVATYLSKDNEGQPIRRFNGTYYNEKINGYVPIGGYLTKDNGSIILSFNEVTYTAPIDNVCDAQLY